MGITDKVKSLFRSRDKPQNHTGDNLFSFLYNWGMTWTGKRITGYNAMQTTGVYACVRRGPVGAWAHQCGAFGRQGTWALPYRIFYRYTLRRAGPACSAVNYRRSIRFMSPKGKALFGQSKNLPQAVARGRFLTELFAAAAAPLGGHVAVQLRLLA